MPLSVLRAPPVSSNTFSWTIRAPNRLADASQRIAIQPVLGMRTNDQEPSAPLFPDEVLRQRIRQHRAGWQRHELRSLGSPPRASDRRWRSTLKKRRLRPASAAFSSGSAGRSVMMSVTPRSASAIIAAAGLSPGRTRTSSSENCWFRNLPVVLLSSIASRAPASPLSSGGISIRDRRAFASIAAQIHDLGLGGVGASRHPREQHGSR